MLSFLPSYSSASVLLLIALFILGIIFLSFGSNTLLKGGKKFAQILAMKEYTIGLTLVALSTSMPEFFVSIKAATSGLPSIAFTNVVGSNIFNTMFIYALLLLFLKGKTKVNLWNLLALTVLSSVLVFYVFLGTIPRYLGIILLSLLPVYVWMQLRIKDPLQMPQGQELPPSQLAQDQLAQGQSSEVHKAHVQTQTQVQTTPLKKLLICLRSLFYMGLGTMLLYLGSELFLNSSLELGARIGISQRILGLVVISIGTGLPELFVTLATLFSILMAKHKGTAGSSFTELGEGNLLGSNIINILLIVGCSAILNPIHSLALLRTDILMLLLSNVALFVLLSKRKSKQHVLGILLLIVYAGYLVFLFHNN